MRGKLAACFVCSVLASIVASSAVLAANYTTRYLMPAPGDQSCSPVGINSAGQVVGQSMVYTTHYSTVIWEPDGSITHVAEMSFYGATCSINDSGEVCGTYGTSGNIVPFYWKQGVGTTNINAGGLSSPRMIANSGLILGTSASGVRGIYNRQGNRLRTLSGGYRINDLGVAVGTVYPENRAAVWAIDGSRQLLNPPVGYATSWGNDINSGGWVVGGISDKAGSNYFWPVVWDPAGTPTVLTTSTTLGGAANAIDNHGNIVGWMYGTDGRHAVVWDTSGAIISDLGLGDAIDISDSGYILGSSGPSMSAVQTVWMPVPEPSCLVALVCGLGGMCVMLRRRSR